MSKQSPKAEGKKAPAKASKPKVEKSAKVSKTSKKVEAKVEKPKAPKAKVKAPTKVAEPVVAAKPKSNKKLIWAGVAVLIVAVCAALFWSLTTVSQQDYKDAHEAVSKVRKEYLSSSDSVKNIGNALSSSSPNVSAEKLKKSFADYNASVDELKGLKAWRDKEANEKYEAFVKKNEGFNAYVDAFTGSMDELSEISKNCNAMGTAMSTLGFSSNPDAVLSRYDDKAKPCIAALEKLKDSKVKSLADFAKNMVDAMNDMRETLDEVVAAAKSGDRTKAYRLNSQIYAKARQVRSAATDFQKALKEEAQEADVKDELNALGQLVTDRANGKK